MIMRVMIIIRHRITMQMPVVRVNLMTVLEIHRHTRSYHVNQRDREEDKTMEQATHRYPTDLCQTVQPPKSWRNLPEKSSAARQITPVGASEHFLLSSSTSVPDDNGVFSALLHEIHLTLTAAYCPAALASRDIAINRERVRRFIGSKHKGRSLT